MAEEGLYMCTMRQVYKDSEGKARFRRRLANLLWFWPWLVVIGEKSRVKLSLASELKEPSIMVGVHPLLFLDL